MEWMFLNFLIKNGNAGRQLSVVKFWMIPSAKFSWRLRKQSTKGDILRHSSVNSMDTIYSSLRSFFINVMQWKHGYDSGLTMDLTPALSISIALRILLTEWLKSGAMGETTANQYGRGTMQSLTPV